MVRPIEILLIEFFKKKIFATEEIKKLNKNFYGK
jgi:hypothetical protein